MQNHTLVSVDLAKDVFQVAVSEEPGKVARRPRLRRDGFLDFFAQLKPATVVMEACGSAHFWGRRIEELGHRVVLLPAHYVRPYVLRNKTDRTDTDGMLEAYRNQGIQPVPIKNVTQQVIGSLHRLRSGWLAERTARVNSLRGLLRELGYVIPEGRKHVLPEAWEIIQDPNSGLPDALRSSFAAVCEELLALDKRIEDIEQQLKALAKQMPIVQRLLTVPGIGLLTATALYAFIGDVGRFPSGRHLASYLGLTPREYSSGLRRRLGRISKRGDRYLRMLLVHGARSVLARAHNVKQPDRLRSWALRLEKTAGHNKATVALANKIVRIVYSAWKHDRDYIPVVEPQAA